MGLRPLPTWRTARVDRSDGRVRITTAPRRVVLQWVLLAGLLLAWSYGGVSAARDLLDPGQVARRGWVAGWLIFWVAIGVYALARLLVLAVGRELVKVDSRFLTLRREVGSIGRSRVFDLSQVRSLRYATPPPVGHAPVERGWPPLPLSLLGGSIRFECGKRTHEFGFGTDWKDMEAVLQALRERVPVGHGPGPNGSAKLT